MVLSWYTAPRNRATRDTPGQGVFNGKKLLGDVHRVGAVSPQTRITTSSCLQRIDRTSVPTPKLESVMEIHEYENAYYQVQDEVIESLPLEKDEEAFLD